MILSNFKSELSQFQSQMQLTEQNHLSGTSPLMWEVLQIEEHLDKNVKSLLSYFLPLIQWIMDDWEKIAQCFQIFINTELEINPCILLSEKVKTTSVEKWRVGLNMIIGGEKLKSKDCVQVKIFPKDSEELVSFLKGGTKRVLLEKVLCPIFLPKEIDYTIDIELKQNSPFQFTWGNQSRVDFQTFIVVD